MTSSIEERERAKYESIWQFPQYRKYSPGEDCVHEAFSIMGMQPGDSLIDFGCGSGRPAASFRKQGINVLAVDFASNCLDPGIDVAFLKCCLWDMPSGVRADWGFCTDVMEHIPKDKIDDVLANIKESVRKGVFFQINCEKDNCGKLIGETLHVSLMSPGEWVGVLNRHWAYAHVLKDDRKELRVICQ